MSLLLISIFHVHKIYQKNQQVMPEKYQTKSNWTKNLPLSNFDRGHHGPCFQHQAPPPVADRWFPHVAPDEDTSSDHQLNEWICKHASTSPRCSLRSEISGMHTKIMKKVLVIHRSQFLQQPQQPRSPTPEARKKQVAVWTSCLATMFPDRRISCLQQGESVKEMHLCWHNTWSCQMAL